MNKNNKKKHWTNPGTLQKSLSEYNLHKIVKSETSTEDEISEAQHKLKFLHDESQLRWEHKNRKEGYNNKD